MYQKAESPDPVDAESVDYFLFELLSLRFELTWVFQSFIEQLTERYDSSFCTDSTAILASNRAAIASRVAFSASSRVIIVK